ncbi:APC family permease, partial [Arthrobacter sp. 18067]|uniref:APC family permease n=1 Tax=Arthrobacter sp. 18067 TaxID=2681413 RepID=UPI00135675B6
MAAVLGATPLVFMQNGAGASGTYVLAAVLFLVFSVGYVAMSRFVGSAGGFVTYIARGFSHRAGTAAAYVALLVYGAMLCGMYGAYSVFAQQLIEQYFGIFVPWQLITVVTIVIMAALAYNKVEFSTRILAVLLLAEVLVLLVLDGAIMFQGSAGGGGQLSYEGFSPAAVFTGGLGIAFLFALSSFGGFEATVIYSEEARNPRRTIPLATYAAVLLIAVFYAVTTWAIANGAGTAEIQNVATADPVGFILALSDHYVGSTWSNIMSALVVTSFLGILLGFTNIVSRYVFALGRVGVLPKALASTHPIHHSPHKASIIVSAATVVTTGIFMLAQADPFTTMYTNLLALGTVGLLTITGITSIAVVAFFARNSRGENRWSTTIAPIISTFGFAAAIYLSIQNYDLLTGGQGGVAGWLWVLIPIAGAIGYAIGHVRGRERIDFTVAETEEDLNPEPLVPP